ncbi:MAG: 23S rRNA (guanosine(2251)-2'-O)-methyltransferase RlmB [Deltaproteobacteria bacterium]|nr:23S rRNA (guanosine(2251)-2'-O)-methyltransferase RlmB [Deltaproteobacteria bacterium]
MEANQTVIYGINAVLEKLRASPDEIVEIVLMGEAGRVVQREAENLGVRVVQGSRESLDRITLGQRHQGVAARVAAFRYWPVTELFESVLTAPGPKRVLILDSLTDPRNFGALLRTAECAGAPRVIIPKDRSVSVNSTVIKASAGAAHHVKVYRVTNLRQVMKQLKIHGFWLAGLDLQAQTSIYDRTYPDKLAIVLGAEGQGMRPLVRQECDFCVSIPMIGRIASLNVAVAGAVFLYEVLRQHGNIDKAGT